MQSRPIRAARRAAATKASRMRTSPAASMTRGAGSWGSCGRADGAWVGQPPASGAISWPPCHGNALDALRPAWPSWIASGMSEYLRIPSTTRPRAASLASDHSPRQAGVMRPSGSTPVASMISSPAPDKARLPRCIRCQSWALPSTAEYWHMGGMTMRLGRARPSRSKGVNKADMERLLVRGVNGGGTARIIPETPPPGHRAWRSSRRRLLPLSLRYENSRLAADRRPMPPPARTQPLAMPHPAPSQPHHCPLPPGVTP